MLTFLKLRTCHSSPLLLRTSLALVFVCDNHVSRCLLVVCVWLRFLLLPTAPKNVFFKQKWNDLPKKNQNRSKAAVFKTKMVTMTYPNSSKPFKISSFLNKRCTMTYANNSKAFKISVFLNKKRCTMTNQTAQNRSKSAFFKKNGVHFIVQNHLFFNKNGIQ